MNSGTRGRVVLLLIFIAAIAGAQLYFAGRGLPVLDGDALVFVPPMRSLAAGDGLVNTTWTDARKIDPSGPGRLVSHGFLFPVLVGKLTWKADYEIIRLIITTLYVTAVSLSALLLWQIKRRSATAFTWADAALIGLMTAVCGGYLGGLPGRPEALASLWLVAGVLLMFRAPSRFHWVIAGVAIGLTGATHPIGAALAGGLFAACAFWRAPFRPATGEILGAGVLSIGVFVCTFAWYPYPAADWFAGVTRTAHHGVVRGWHADAAFYWFTNPGSFLAGPIHGLGALCGGWLIASRWGRIQCRWGLMICMAVWLGAAWYFGVRVSARSYNLLLFAPLVFGLIYHTVLLLCADSRRPARRSWLAPSVLVPVFLASLGFWRSLLLHAVSVRHAMDVATARAHLAAMASAHPGQIAVSSGLFMAVGDLENVIVFQQHEPVPAVEFVVLQQAYRRSMEPPPIEGFTLRENHFLARQPRLMGLKLGNVVPGYNFAVYSRTGAP